MKKRVLAAAGIVLLLSLTAVFFSTLRTPGSVAFIRVVDAAGRPVAGATITPDGLRPKKGGAHYWWGGDIEISGLKAVSVQTDADGYAKVAYPFYVHEKLETGEISFAVDHPDFCAQRPFRIVAASPPQNASFKAKAGYFAGRLLRKISSHPDPVVLKRGAIVHVTGYIGTKDNRVTNVQAEISGMWPAGTNFWHRTGPSLWTRKASAGKTFLRAAYCPEKEPPLFSDVMIFNASTGQTNAFELELKPGVRVTGRLDDAVPRPIRNGRVCIHVYVEKEDGNSEAPIWFGWRPLNDDGAFVFESLPRGRLEIMGLCDGFLSRIGLPPRAITTTQRVPQAFDLRNANEDITLTMEPSASCEVTVLDDAGRPVPGATAAFWPNILWGGNGSTIFGGDVFSTEDFFRNPPLALEVRREKTKDDFHATTDAQGVAHVRNLPPGSQSYAVRHTNFDMPIVRSGNSAQRSASVTLTGGSTSQVSVTMQKKGTEALTH